MTEDQFNALMTLIDAKIDLAILREKGKPDDDRYYERVATATHFARFELLDD